LLRSSCAYPRSKTAGYYDAAKQNWRATLNVKIALPMRQEREEYKLKRDPDSIAIIIELDVLCSSQHHGIGKCWAMQYI